MVLNQRLQAGIAITLLEPDPLARNNILSFFPRIFLQGLVVIAVGTEPQRNPIPLAIRFRKRDRHIGDSPFGATDEVHQRSAANYTPRPVTRQASRVYKTAETCARFRRLTQGLPKRVAALADTPLTG